MRAMISATRVLCLRCHENEVFAKRYADLFLAFRSTYSNLRHRKAVPAPSQTQTNQLDSNRQVFTIYTPANYSYIVNQYMDTT